MSVFCLHKDTLFNSRYPATRCANVVKWYTLPVYQVSIPPTSSGRESMLLQVHFLLICVSEKCHFSVKIFRRYVSCEKRVEYVLW